ncbi:MAG: cation transporter [Sphingomonadales bacterium]|nr:cation transporter [Sphingomonadales bacterium]
MGAHDHHDHGTGHGHSHENHDHAHGGHRHGHAPANFDSAFLIGISLNVGFVVLEAIYGFAANSMALLADAGHNLSDVFGLLMAWGAAAAGKRAASKRFTYGWRKSSVLAALFNAVFLLVAVGAIAVEAVRRFGEPQAVGSNTVMTVAALGILINGATALLFARGRAGDINIRGAYLHMASDAAVSAGVVVSGFIIARTGWAWLDPATSLVIVAVIVLGTWGLLRDSVTMAMDAVPPSIDPAAVESALGGLPGVTQVHHIHIWPMSTTESALTAHLVTPGGQPGDAFLRAACSMLKTRFGIQHATIQVEIDEGACAPEGHHAH